MENQMEWLAENAHWIFSGIGVFVLSFLIGLLLKNRRRKTIVQKQRAGKGSVNVQSAGDINIGVRNDRK